MSASSKKKIRKEIKEAKMTERQRKEQAEAKKLKIYSIAFTALIVAIIVVTLTVIVWQAVDNAGLVPKWTTALTIGEHKINCVEMNYYYRYAISAFLQNGGNDLDTVYALYGVDLTQPLDQQQYYNEDRMWSDFFMEEAIDLAISDYTMADAAAAAGYTLPADEQTTLDDEFLLVESNALTSGYTDIDEFVRAYYGNGSDYKSYKAFVTRNALAESYRIAYTETVTVPEDQITSYNEEHFDEYSSFSYSYYTLTFTRFLSGGTTDEDGNLTYTDEQHEASQTAAKEAADILSQATTPEEFNAAIAGLDINKDLEEPATGISASNVLYSSVPEDYREWMADSSRKAGDITVVDRVTTSYDENDVATETVSGYIVVCFTSRDDSEAKMDNVRHILIAVQDDEVTGETSTDTDSFEYAKEQAEAVYNEWKEGTADEAGFIALVDVYSEDTVEGGLYENISRFDNYYTGNFSNEAKLWAVDDARQVGDVEIVESELGYHIMYYVGEAEDNYRHYTIENLLRERLAEEWYNTVTANAKATIKRGSVKPIDVSAPPYTVTTTEE